LRGAGETPIVLAGAILGGWLIRLPLAYFGGVVSGAGMTVVWISMILDWIVRGGVFGWQFRRMRLRDVRL
jgi:Na+-driven multidrug efflux pump